MADSNARAARPLALPSNWLPLLSPDMPVKGANLQGNVDERRIVIVRRVADAA